MSVRLRHVLRQGPVLAAMVRGSLSAVRGRRGPGATEVEAPGPWLRATVPPRDPELVADYLRHLGVDPSAYPGTVPPHLFPQWVFPLQARVLEGLPYPLHKVLNGGCRLEARGALRLGEPLLVATRLDGIDDDGRRAVLRLVARIGTHAEPDAVEAALFAVVPLRRRPNQDKGRRKEAARVSGAATELERWELRRRAGLDFAMLTGDFNPIHWLRPYARMVGFRDVILHGFATFGRVWEGLRRQGGGLRVLDARFTRPLELPADVGLFVDGSRVWVGPAPGGLAYLEGTYDS